jgi:hypothetical protein
VHAYDLGGRILLPSPGGILKARHLQVWKAFSTSAEPSTAWSTHRGPGFAAVAHVAKVKWVEIAVRVRELEWTAVRLHELGWTEELQSQVERSIESAVGTKVFEVIQSYAETVTLFREFGFSMTDNLVAQRVFARSTSLEQACRLKDV